MNFPKMKNTLVIVLLSVMTCLTAFGQQKESPIYDVVVVGGGPAGIGAALASAKTGAHTVLVERDYRIGGTIPRLATTNHSRSGLGKASSSIQKQ